MFLTSGLALLWPLPLPASLNALPPLSMQRGDPKLPKKSWVKICQIRTPSVKRIRNKIGRASEEEELALVFDGFDEIVGGWSVTDDFAMHCRTLLIANRRGGSVESGI
jgi:mRNA interferase MazF